MPASELPFRRHDKPRNHADLDLDRKNKRVEANAGYLLNLGKG